MVEFLRWFRLLLTSVLMTRLFPDASSKRLESCFSSGAHEPWKISSNPSKAEALGAYELLQSSSASAEAGEEPQPGYKVQVLYFCNACQL